MKLDFDSKFQEGIVRLLFQDKSFGEAALEHLKPDLFENRIHSWVVKTMKQQLQVNGTMPDALVLGQERRKAEKLGIIQPEDSSSYRVFLKRKLHRPVPNRSYVKGELQRFVKHQAMKAFIMDAVKNKMPRGEFEAIDASMAALMDIDVTGDYSLGTRPGASFVKRIKKRETVEEPGITTGIAELDRLMVRGGLTPKQLGTIIAPTGRGKTNFLINIAASAVLEGTPTLYITLELDEETIATRMDARFTSVPLNSLRSSKQEVLKAWKTVKPLVKDKLIIKEFPPGTTTIAQIKQYIRKLERIAFYPKLILFDYADLLKPSIEYADSSYESQGKVYLDILGLLAELKVAGWTATQGNRKSMDTEQAGEVDLSMMADSIKKAFLAYVVLGIAQSAKEKKFKKGRVVILKNRNGPADRELKVAIHHDVVTFRSIT